MDGEAERRAEHGEGDAGVAAGGVEQGFAGSEQAAGAGIADHGRGGAVFDAAAGVGPLRFGQQRDALKAADDLVEPQQGRGPDLFRQR